VIISTIVSALTNSRFDASLSIGATGSNVTQQVAKHLGYLGLHRQTVPWVNQYTLKRTLAGTGSKWGHHGRSHADFDPRLSFLVTVISSLLSRSDAMGSF
jgi:hypothetical protein